MNDRPTPTPENERQFLFRQGAEVLRRAGHETDQHLPITIRYESPTLNGKKVTFKGLPKEVIDQIDTMGHQVARAIVS